MTLTAPKPVFAAMAYMDPKTGALTAGGQQALGQWQTAIKSIPISVSGEQAKGAATNWTLANLPAANVALTGFTATGPVPLAPGKGNAWNYAIDGKQIITEQAFEGVMASYEYTQG